MIVIVSPVFQASQNEIPLIFPSLLFSSFFRPIQKRNFSQRCFSLFKIEIKGFAAAAAAAD